MVEKSRKGVKKGQVLKEGEREAKGPRVTVESHFLNQFACVSH